jgi:formylglycine-generating enzyme required for sulfatase activity
MAMKMKNQIRSLACMTASIAMVLGFLLGNAIAQEKIETITNSIGLKLALIPEGSFEMGSPRDEPERERIETIHMVTISRPFYMGIFEVTQSEFAKVMEGIELHRRPSFPGERNPAENVEWKNAKFFCERLSELPEEKAAGRRYRLPTEAEWEYACRAGTKTAFHYGDALSSEQANFNGNYPAGAAEKGPYLRSTAPVGSYEPNAFGLYDMHGNLAEWCNDFYDPDYYENSPDKDPLGPPLGIIATDFDNFGDKNFFMVVRGGCWLDDGRACRSAYRFKAMPNTQYRLIGFRVVCEVDTQSDQK